jgi:hypothetical protein
MGDSGKDDELVLECSRTGSVIAAALLPISLILQSDDVFALFVVLYVGVATAIHHANGRRLVDAIAGCLGAALLVIVPESDPAVQAMIALAISTTLLAAFLKANRRIGSDKAQRTSSITQEA